MSHHNTQKARYDIGDLVALYPYADGENGPSAHDCDAHVPLVKITEVVATVYESGAKRIRHYVGDELLGPLHDTIKPGSIARLATQAEWDAALADYTAECEESHRTGPGYCVNTLDAATGPRPVRTTRDIANAEHDHRIPDGYTPMAMPATPDAYLETMRAMSAMPTDPVIGEAGVIAPTLLCDYCPAPISQVEHDEGGLCAPCRASGPPEESGSPEDATYACPGCGQTVTAHRDSDAYHRSLPCEDCIEKAERILDRATSTPATPEQLARMILAGPTTDMPDLDGDPQMILDWYSEQIEPLLDAARALAEHVQHAEAHDADAPERAWDRDVAANVDRIADRLASEYGASRANRVHDGGWVIEGDRLGTVTCRIILNAAGQLSGAWDPDDMLAELRADDLLPTR